MTCIVAVAQGGKIWMGGDSAGVGPGYSLQQRADTKVFRNGPYMFGFTSSFRMGQLLRYRFKPSRPHPTDDLLEHMSTDFVDEARRCLKDYGFARVEHMVEQGGTFLVGVGGRLFRIEEDYQVGESNFPFAACGCGEDLALGVLHAFWATERAAEAKLEPRDVVERALQAAEAFSAGVRSPFHIIESGGE